MDIHTKDTILKKFIMASIFLVPNNGSYLLSILTKIVNFYYINDNTFDLYYVLSVLSDMNTYHLKKTNTASNREEEKMS